MVSTRPASSRATPAPATCSSDDFAGTGGDARRDTLIRLLGDAAKGEDCSPRRFAFWSTSPAVTRSSREGDALMAEGSDMSDDIRKFWTVLTSGGKRNGSGRNNDPHRAKSPASASLL